MKHSHLKKTRKSGGKAVKHLALLLALTVVLCAATVGTVAYFTATDKSTSTGLTIGQVACKVENSGDTYTITNTGNVEAYIRVAVVANTVENGVIVGNATPTVTYDTNKVMVKDGFYYYKGLLAANGTMTLKITAVDDVQVSVLAEALQPGAAQDAWDYAPSGN